MKYSNRNCLKEDSSYAECKLQKLCLINDYPMAWEVTMLHVFKSINGNKRHLQTKVGSNQELTIIVDRNKQIHDFQPRVGKLLDKYHNRPATYEIMNELANEVDDQLKA